LEFEKGKRGTKKYEEIFLLPFIAVDICVLSVYKFSYFNVTNVAIKYPKICNKCYINLFSNIYII